MLLKSVLERRVEKERDRHPHGTGEGGVGESEGHTDVSLAPREGQEWRVPMEAARDRLDLRRVLSRHQLLPRGLSLSCPLGQPAAPTPSKPLAWPGSHPPHPFLHTPPHAQRGRGVVAFPVVVPFLEAPDKC